MVTENRISILRRIRIYGVRYGLVCYGWPVRFLERLSSFSPAVSDAMSRLSGESNTGAQYFPKISNILEEGESYQVYSNISSLKA